jgi:hypothetical protein
MRRSGNHAIIEWIASHFLNTVHFNDCWGWKRLNYNSRHVYGCSKCKQELVIRSYEDFYPSKAEMGDNRTVVILRDFYNMMSSRLVTKRDHVRERHKQHYISTDIVGTWLQYAKLYDHYSDKFILYNKWVSDPNYRLKVQNNLGLDILRGNFVSQFPQSGVGKGSSFDKDVLNLGEVNERYRVLRKERPELYKKLYNEEVRIYCKNIFNLDIYGEIGL